MTIAAVVAAFAAVSAGLGWRAVRRHRERAQGLRELAERIGWTFEPVPPNGALGPLPGLEAFAGGRRHALRNRMSGSRGGFAVWAADLSYVTGQPAGPTKGTWLQTVVHVDVQPAHLPRFSLRPRRFFHSIPDDGALHDVQPRAGGIAPRWLLRGEADAAVADLFGEDVAELLESHRLLFAEGAGADLYVWSTGVLASPAEMEGLLNAAVDLATRLRANSAASPPQSTRPPAPASR